LKTLNKERYISLGKRNIKMGRKERLEFSDSLQFIHYDKNGKIVGKFDSTDIPFWTKLWQRILGRHNSITNDGFANIAGLVLSDVGGVAYDYMAIGTGTIPADPTDIALGEQSGTRLVTEGSRSTISVDNDTAQWVTTFSQANDPTLTGTDAITEVGIFNAVSGDNKMLLRIVFAAESMNWDAGDSLQMTVKCQMKQGT